MHLTLLNYALTNSSLVRLIYITVKIPGKDSISPAWVRCFLCSPSARQGDGFLKGHDSSHGNQMDAEEAAGVPERGEGNWTDQSGIPTVDCLRVITAHGFLSSRAVLRLNPDSIWVSPASNLIIRYWQRSCHTGGWLSTVLAKLHASLVLSRSLSITFYQ